MYEDIERISIGLRAIYESIRDDEMQRHRIKEVHQILRWLDNDITTVISSVIKLEIVQ